MGAVLAVAAYTCTVPSTLPTYSFVAVPADTMHALRGVSELGRGGGNPVSLRGGGKGACSLVHGVAAPGPAVFSTASSVVCTSVGCRVSRMLCRSGFVSSHCVAACSPLSALGGGETQDGGATT